MKPEILAPAGGMEALIAGVRTGADAVYLGGKLFSARRSAGNFSEEELEQAVRFCHARGVKVHLAVNTAVKDSEMAAAAAFVAQALRTGVDALAVAIGTAHGAYKEKPRLDIGRLAEISRTVPVPLVLHGGSGLSDEDFKNCVANGISKINIFTDINCAAAKAAYDNYSQGCGLTDIQNQITEAVKQETMKKMRVFGSAGRG